MFLSKEFNFGNLCSWHLVSTFMILNYYIYVSLTNIFSQLYCHRVYECMVVVLLVANLAR